MDKLDNIGVTNIPDNKLILLLIKELIINNNNVVNKLFIYNRYRDIDRDIGNLNVTQLLGLIKSFAKIFLNHYNLALIYLLVKSRVCWHNKLRDLSGMPNSETLIRTLQKLKDLGLIEKVPRENKEMLQIISYYKQNPVIFDNNRVSSAGSPPRKFYQLNQSIEPILKTETWLEFFNRALDVNIKIKIDKFSNNYKRLRKKDRKEQKKAEEERKIAEKKRKEEEKKDLLFKKYQEFFKDYQKCEICDKEYNKLMFKNWEGHSICNVCFDDLLKKGESAGYQRKCHNNPRKVISFEEWCNNETELNGTTREPKDGN